MWHRSDRSAQTSLLFVTKSSMCKLVEGAEFDVAKRTIASTKLAEDDELIFIGSVRRKWSRSCSRVMEDASCVS